MRIFLPAAVSTLLLSPAMTASAQDLDFGSWCSDIARYSPDRCAEAQPDDKSAYDRYLDRIQLFNDELNKRTEARRLENERVNQMGDVTPDRDPGRDSADPK